VGARFRSWQQEIRKHRVAIGVVAIVLVVVIALIIVGYWFDWTGFNGYNKITVAHTISGTNAGTVTKTEESQPGKGLWDWLQLLIIPAVLAVAGYVINLTISRGEQEATKQRDKTEHEIAEDNQREAALQAYINKMSELLLEKKLRESVDDDEVRKIARIHTLTVLPRLDANRKASVLLFLYESSLIDKVKCIIDLSGANLSLADLGGSDLSGANLSEANLIGAILSGATLIGANLSMAQLCGATLFGANLRRADLSMAELHLNLDQQIRISQKKYPYLHRTILIGADLSEADLSGTYLEGAHLSGANLSGTNLRGAFLIGANLGKTMREDNMKRIEVDTVNKYWTISGISLETLSVSFGTSELGELYARFQSGANLSKANLSGAVLHQVDLRKANLKDATGITVEELKKQAKSLQGATMPDGSIHT